MKCKRWLQTCKNILMRQHVACQGEHNGQFFWGRMQHMSGSLDAADKVCDKCLVTETQTDKNTVPECTV